VNEIVVAGPFKTRQAALNNQEQLKRIHATSTNTGPLHSKHLHPSYARVIASVLRKQEKVLTAALGEAS
jgi:hypothetical protein